MLLSKKKKLKRIIALILSCILTISGIKYQEKIEAETSKRYSVLILDGSGSMYGTPMEKEKVAALKFCDSALKAGGENYVAIVEINTESSVIQEFTNDYALLENKIEALEAYGGTNITDALGESNDLLNDADDKAKKNIILCTDGLPESGSYSYSGQYIYGDYENYEYANKCYETAKSITKSKIYTLGFFHHATGKDLLFARRFMKDIQNAGYYDVIYPEELEFAFDDISDDILDGSKEFTYDNGYTERCYYKDSYFNESSYNYNASLATMSLCFAVSAFGAGQVNDYENKSKNARYMLNSIIGVSDDTIETNDWFKTKPTTDSIGVIAGNKSIKVGEENYTLIAVAIRGGGYEKEWASNFTIGSSGQHVGFNTAKNNVIAFLKKYISNQNITGKVKLWITGYSRAGATANLVGGELDNTSTISSNVTYNKGDIYTYCFEPPAGALASDVDGKSVYNNIFNIINRNDPVPYVAPKKLGFFRYGIDYYLPDKGTTASYSSQKDKMSSIYNTLDNTKSYTIDDFQMKKIKLKTGIFSGEDFTIIQNDSENNMSQGQFLENYIKKISTEFIISRENYVSKYQNGIREICKVMFGCEDGETEKFTESVTNQIKNNWSDFLLEYINPFSTEKDALKIVSGWLNQAVKDSGIKGINSNEIENAGIYLGDLLLAVASSHPNYLTTAICNIDRIGSAHYPELCYSWLASMDENYSDSIENTEITLNSGVYRIIRINCKVDITVKDSDGNIVASIVNESPKKINGSSIVSGKDGNGEKYVILPPDEDYNISIKAREDGTVNIGINEYSSREGDYSRDINYFDISLKSGKAIDVDVPSISSDELTSGITDGSSVNYEVKTLGKILKASKDLRGKDAMNAYYTVKLTNNNSKAGVVLGGGVYQYGNFAQISATAKYGYKFIGWYCGNKKLSDKKEYRFCVKGNKTVSAKFEKIKVGTSKITKVIAKNKGLKVSWKKVSKVSGYQIKYSLKKSFKKSKTLTLTYKKHSKFIKKLKKNKIYYVKIRTFKKVDGYVLYSNWSKSKKRKTK